MGYTTDFYGTFKLNKQLSLDDKNFLTKFAETRRMARNVDPKYGVDGEFYIDGSGFMGQGHDDTIVDYNRPPRTQPGLWCKWVPTDDGWGIEWNGEEKFYDYLEWLEYIIKNFLAPKGYTLNGKVDWYGEDSDDRGTIVVVDNVITTRAQGPDGDGATRLFFVVDSMLANEEIFETLEGAEKLYEAKVAAKDDSPRIRVCIVRNAYREHNGGWNYDDQANTFETVKVIKE